MAAASTLVIWNARTSDVHDNRLPSWLDVVGSTGDSEKVYIVVSPLRNGLFRINVIRKGMGGMNERITLARDHSCGDSGSLVQ
jgi:hypothetical protein